MPLDVLRAFTIRADRQALPLAIAIRFGSNYLPWLITLAIS
jgi:hypothetical protein